eukprot:CAMPEP_0172916586 /NCGR_PEP_ID=MMETSP1075-20121228/196669_1 /TAXON_ID=2916 /ORGANISM="Ceratium fusus, Strain PA161109" /LENGTH=88 /DNA_ID=CAMNT_0013775903 /DNA_START=31 /DNA_END=294 /DNA_ORIENTATION=+
MKDFGSRLEGADVLFVDEGKWKPVRAASQEFATWLWHAFSLAKILFDAAMLSRWLWRPWYLREWHDSWQMQLETRKGLGSKSVAAQCV